MAIYHEDIVTVELSSGSIHRSFLNHSIGSGDSAANRFGIRVLRNGEEVDLSGCSCYGYFRDPQGNNIALTANGTVDGSLAYVTLPQACYNYEGQFCLAIKLIGGGVTGTMRIVDGMVDNTHTGGAVAPTGAVPSYSEIISQYDAMVAATAAANGCIAETFDATKAYKAGQYVINSGALYRLTADHAANTTWANTSKAEVKFGNELSDTKSVLEGVIDLENIMDCLLDYSYGFGDKKAYTSSSASVEIRQFGTKITVNGNNGTSTTNIRFKLNGGLAYASSNSAVDSWANPVSGLKSGHKYKVSLIFISGSVSHEEGAYYPNATVYKAGGHASVLQDTGRGENGIDHSGTFVAESGVSYHFAFVLNMHSSATSAIFQYIVEDITKKTEDLLGTIQYAEGSAWA